MNLLDKMNEFTGPEQNLGEKNTQLYKKCLRLQQLNILKCTEIYTYIQKPSPYIQTKNKIK